MTSPPNMRCSLNPMIILKLFLADLLKITPAQLSADASIYLASVIIEQRSHKDDEEVAELEEAITLTRRMLASARAAIEPGRLESDVMSALLAPALAKERQQAFSKESFCGASGKRPAWSALRPFSQAAARAFHLRPWERL